MSDIGRWQAGIEACLRGRCSLLREAIVLEEAGSTQDVARERLLPRGTVGAVLARRQTAGRGRLGRSWADTGEDGVAVTFVLPDRRAEELVVLAAVAACRAIERAAGSPGCRIGIKWPNDLILSGRKLGGILIERPASAARRVLVGIGINVAQTAFPSGLDGRATSLALGGHPAERLSVAVELLASIDQLMGEVDAGAALRDYLDRDALRGALATFATAEGEVAGEVTGRVLEAHPLEGIAVACADGERRLPTATTSVVAWTPPAI